MTVQGFEVSSFAENTYVVHHGDEAVLIDPGTETEAERREVEDYVEERDLRVVRLLLTHAHLDHVLGCAYFADRYDGRFDLHPAALELYRHADEQAEAFGVPLDPLPEPGSTLEEDDRIAWADAEVEWEILHCPGHSPGSICFYDRARDLLIGGDVLFRGSVGRTDLWKGSMETLLTSIRSKVLSLPDETVVYPGHGPTTTVGEERRTNPFLVEQSADPSP